MDRPGTTKTFWERPEGKTGLIFIAAMVIGGGIGLYSILPFLITLTTNIIHLGILCGVIGGVLFLGMNRQFQINVSSLFKIAMRKMTGIVITIDPIAILKNYVRDLYRNLEDMYEQIGDLKGVMKGLQTKMLELKNEINGLEQLASNAEKAMNNPKATDEQKQRLKSQVMLNKRKAKRRKETHAKFNILHKKMEMIYRVLVKMYNNCEMMAEDKSDEIKGKEAEWKSIKKAHSAIKSAMSFVNGDGDERATYEQTLEHMAETMGNQMGEMEHFLDMSATLMDSIDLQNESFDDGVVAELEKWERNSQSWLLGDDKETIIAETNDENNTLNVDDLVIDENKAQNVKQKLNLFQ